MYERRTRYSGRVGFRAAMTNGSSACAEGHATSPLTKVKRLKRLGFRLSGAIRTEKRASVLESTWVYSCSLEYCDFCSASDQPQVVGTCFYPHAPEDRRFRHACCPAMDVLPEATHLSGHLPEDPRLCSGSVVSHGAKKILSDFAVLRSQRDGG